MVLCNKFLRLAQSYGHYLQARALLTGRHTDISRALCKFISNQRHCRLSMLPQDRRYYTELNPIMGSHTS